MSYSTDYASAARRHLEAADGLDQTKRRDVAGYLYGIAGECAFKQIMRESGMVPDLTEKRKENPFFAHWPFLRTLLKDRIHGRRHGELETYASDDRLFANWTTDMRYSPGRDVKPEDVDLWREQARTLVNRIGI